MNTYSGNSGVYEDPCGEWMKVDDHVSVEFANKCLRKEIKNRETQHERRVAHVEKLKNELKQERRKSAKWETAHSGLQAVYAGICEAEDVKGAPWSGHPQDKPMNYRVAMEELKVARKELSLTKDAKADMIHAEQVADSLGEDLREAKAKAERLEYETELKVDALKDEITKFKEREVDYQNIIGQRNSAVKMLVDALEAKEGPVDPFASSMWANEMPKAADTHPPLTDWQKLVVNAGYKCGKTVATELAAAAQVVSAQKEEIREADCLIKSLEASIVAQGGEAVKQQEEIEDLSKERYRLSNLVEDYREKFARIREVSSDVGIPESEFPFQQETTNN